MPRKLRLEYEGAIYHIMNRGDRREAIFQDDQDRKRFLETLGETCQKAGWLVQAYCLMSNHFHLVLETPRANLVAGMQWFLGTYTARFNRRHRLFGHLFSGRYKSLIVDGSGNGYLKTVCDYVHLNPARARLIANGQSLHTYQWSSYPYYLLAPKQRPAWLRVERLLGEWGITQDQAQGRDQFALGMEERVQQERRQPSSEWNQLRRGWCWGAPEFREKLLDQVDAEQGVQHYGEELRESEEQKGRRLIQQMLREAGWSEAELLRRAKGDVGKVRMARRLRGETTLTWSWIARQLAMGHWRTAANAVRRFTSPGRED